MKSATTTTRLVRRIAIVGALSVGLVAGTPPAPASAGLVGGLVGTVGGLTGGVLHLLNGITGGTGFLLGRDEFQPTSSTPVWLGQVKTAVKADSALQKGYDGTGVDVALVDTGAVPVPGLDTAGAVTNGPDLSFDRQSGLSEGLDGFGHGTHLAGIIAGRGDAQTAGVAPAARIVNMKVGASNGAVDVSQVIASIDWAVQHRKDPGLNIRVLNLSYGTDAVQSYQVDPLAHAIESAWRSGIVVVVAAGNSGAALTNPAIDPYVLTVGAVDLQDPTTRTDDAVASYSAIGTAARRVDLVAPGTSIISLRNPGSDIDDAHPDARVGDRWFRGSGTSQAAAVTSGLVADLLEARPNLTPDQVKAVLRSTAKLVDRSPASAQGAGMIDLGAAVAALPSLPLTAQSFTRSKGTGSIESARGTSHVTIDGAELKGEQDVQSAPWVGSVWAPKATAGTAWTGGSWNGRVWTGDGWLTGTSLWSGRTWKSSDWTGRTWKGDAWTGRTWKGDIWDGRTWKST